MDKYQSTNQRTLILFERMRELLDARFRTFSKNRLRNMSNQYGQTLIEALVALSVVVVLISAAVVSVISALSNAQYSKNQDLATQYAQEGMELVKKENNTNPGLSGLSPYYCLAGGATSLSGGSSAVCPQTPNVPATNPVFIRQVTIVLNDTSANSNCSGGASATVDVKWADGKCDGSNLYCHDVKIVSCFSNASAVPTL